MLAQTNLLQSVGIDLLRIRQMVANHTDNTLLIYLIEMALQETRTGADRSSATDGAVPARDEQKNSIPNGFSRLV